MPTCIGITFDVMQKAKAKFGDNYLFGGGSD